MHKEAPLLNTKEVIRQNLVHLLEESGSKKVDLARALGMSKSAITNWTNGSNSIDVELVPAICDFFGISVNEFLSAEGRSELSIDERRLVAYYQAMPAKFKVLLMEEARAYANEQSFAPNDRPS